MHFVCKFWLISSLKNGQIKYKCRRCLIFMKFYTLDCFYERWISVAKKSKISYLKFNSLSWHLYAYDLQVLTRKYLVTSRNYISTLKSNPASPISVPQGCQYGPYLIMPICNKNIAYALRKKIQVKPTLPF